jgi:hypothetical protein
MMRILFLRLQYALIFRTIASVYIIVMTDTFGYKTDEIGGQYMVHNSEHAVHFYGEKKP